MHESQSGMYCIVHVMYKYVHSYCDWTDGGPNLAFGDDQLASVNDISYLLSRASF